MRTINIWIYTFSFFFLGWTQAYGVTVSQPWMHDTSSSSEAGYSCHGGRCVAEAPRSNLMRMCEEMRSRAAWAQDWQCMNTAIFNDGQDRERLLNLRNKPENQRTAEEQALVRAADSYGNIRFCNGANGGNAFLIMHNGRPAVVTSGHMFVDNSTGNPKCSEEDVNAYYMPNVSYYDPENPNANQDFFSRSVGLQYPPVNLEEYQAAIKKNNPVANVNADFLIFYLDEDITKDKMPAGHTRGAMSLAQNNGSFDRGQIYMMGVAVDRDNGLATVYQSCDYASLGGIVIQHVCDTLPGSSGSLLMTYEDGEMRVKGIHSAGQENESAANGNSQVFDSVPEDRSKWNSATPVQSIISSQR